MDLYNPAHILILGVHAEIGEFVAMTTKRKSLKNRIARAKRGHPTRGQLPHGRTFDKVTGQWGIDKKQQADILDIAKRYIAGESLERLALEHGEHGMSYTNLNRILNKDCGSQIIQRFNSKRLNIHADVPTTIPELLPREMIEAIHKRAEANRTYNHGQAKHKYLLGRMVFCGTCGYALFGATNTMGKKRPYYKHHPENRIKRKCQHCKKQIPCKELDEPVMAHLFDMFGNAAAIQSAIEEATPNKEKVEESRRKLSRVGLEVEKLEGQIQRATKLYMKGTITEGQADKEILPVREQLKMLNNVLEQTSESIADLPNAKTIQSTAKLIADKRYLNHNYDEMSFEDKRALCEMVFSGKTPDGRRMGIYFKFGKKPSFSLHGHFVNEEGIPVLTEKLRKIFYTECGGHKQKALLSKTRFGKPTHTAAR